MCSVDEKTGYYAVPLLGLAAENIHKLSCSHCEVKLLWVGHDLSRTGIWDFDFSKSVLHAPQIVEVVDKGIYRELFWLIWFVQYEVGREQTEVGKLITEGFIALTGEFEHKSPETAPWYEYTDAITYLWVVSKSSKLVLEVVIHLFQDGGEGFLSFWRAESWPLANKRIQSASHFVNIKRAAALGSHDNTSVGEDFCREESLIRSNDPIEESLVFESTVFKSLNTIRSVVEGQHVFLPLRHRCEVSFDSCDVSQSLILLNTIFC